MKENNLNETKGKKIRRQYFKMPIILLFALMLYIPYCMLLFSLDLGTFDMQEWLSSLWLSVWSCFFCALPWIVLAVLNRSYFGKIICILTEDGLHYSDGWIEWNQIWRIEYVFELPGKGVEYSTKKCHAVIYTKSGEPVVLLHAPHGILKAAKKFHPQIEAQMATGSKWRIVFILLLLLVIPPIIALVK